MQVVFECRSVPTVLVPGHICACKLEDFLLFSND